MNFIDIDIELPNKKLNQTWIDSEIAYNLINDELMDEGTAREKCYFYKCVWS